MGADGAGPAGGGSVDDVADGVGGAALLPGRLLPAGDAERIRNPKKPPGIDKHLHMK